MNEPRIFIGSSSESLDVANVIQTELEGTVPYLWKQRFRWSGTATILQTLEKALDESDFAVLLLTGEDLVESRDDRCIVPRDNVVFEFGLFLGRLGAERTFALYCESDRLKLPSDLAGVTLLSYKKPPKPSDLPAMLGPACGVIRNAVRDLGKRKSPAGLPSIWIQSKRKDQTTAICDHIRKNPVERIDVLQFSLLALDDQFFDAIKERPNCLVRLLLLHPDEAEKYALGKEHSKDVREVARKLGSLAKNSNMREFRCPNIGLWYYRHQPSVAAVMIDESLIQLGWYLRDPDPRRSGRSARSAKHTAQEELRLRVKGDDQPSLLARDEWASIALPQMRAFFNSVLMYAEPAADKYAFIGERREELLEQFRILKTGR